MRRFALAAAALAGLAAARRAPILRAARIIRISRVVADLARSEAFYREALGFRRVAGGPGDAAAARLLGLPATRQVVMRLGGQEIALVASDPAGAAYPADSRSNDLWFQHLAIVVSDMGAAYGIVSAHSPTAISAGGPQTLPPRNGSVSAYKFRDPDGHPLELLQFPRGSKPNWDAAGPGPFLGIDHSALAVASGRRSLAFYRGLGFGIADRSFNHGPAQSRLDGLPEAAVHVSGLRLAGAPGPGLELLRYMPPGRPRPPVPPAAQLTDWVTLDVPALASSRSVTDPDGHLLLLQGRDP